MTSDCEGPGGSRMGEEGEEGPEEGRQVGQALARSSLTSIVLVLRR